MTLFTLHLSRFLLLPASSSSRRVSSLVMTGHLVPVDRRVVPLILGLFSLVAFELRPGNGKDREKFPLADQMIRFNYSRPIERECWKYCNESGISSLSIARLTIASTQSDLGRHSIYLH